MNGVVFGRRGIRMNMAYTPGNNVAVAGQDAMGFSVDRKQLRLLFRLLELVVNHPLNTVFIL